MLYGAPGAPFDSSAPGPSSAPRGLPSYSCYLNRKRACPVKHFSRPAEAGLSLLHALMLRRAYKPGQSVEAMRLRFGAGQRRAAKSHEPCINLFRQN